MEGVSPTFPLSKPLPGSIASRSPSPTTSSVPELTSSSPDQERGSTETTIFTIYSMYGDGDSRDWSASAFENQSRELDLSLGDAFAYKTLDPTIGTCTSRQSCIDFSPSPHFLQSTRTSNYIQPPTDHANKALDGLPLSLRVPQGRTRRNGSAPTSYSSQVSQHCQPPSQLAPLPTPPRSRSPSLRRSHSPISGPAKILTPPAPSSSLAPPPSSHRSSTPATKLHSKLSAPSSKTSLVPSEGEDLDSFHIRSTYAHFDTIGVRGDGFEEGVERTRARSNVSNTSDPPTEVALSNSSEKSRDLPPEERHVLSSLDRYGFFHVATHERLILLPSAPLLKRLSLVTAGPRTAPAQAMAVSSLPPPSSPYKETTRIPKWGRMLEVRGRDRGGNAQSWGVKPSKAHKLRKRIYKGIPDRWRSAAWQVLMNNFSRSAPEEDVKLKGRYYQELDKASSYDIQIDLDVPRTSSHILFRTRYGLGQRALFHVLHSFSLQCAECGYVQGMGPIAATLLSYFEPDKVYTAFTRLHDAYSLHAMFSPGFPGLLEAIYVQERTIQLKMPDVYAAFKKHMISTTAYATKWYITLFANSVPFQTQLRLWDAFLLEGQDVFIVVAIAILWVYRDHITSSSANFESILSLLSSVFVPEDEDALLSWTKQVLGNKKLRKRMRNWRREWAHLVNSGKHGNALL